MWSYDNQDPGLEPVLEQLSKDFEKSHPGREDQPRLQGLQQPRRHRAARARLGQRARRDGGEPGLPDRRPAREGEADPARSRSTSRSTGGTGSTRRRPGGCSAGRPTASRSAGARSGASRRPARTSSPSTTRRSCAQLGLQPEQDAADVRGVRQAPRPAAREAARRRARDRARATSEGYGFIHLFGGIQGAYVKAQTVRNWIYHVPGSRYDTPGTIKALAKLQQWAQGGLLQRRLQRDQVRRLRDGVRARARASSGSAGTGTRRSSRRASALRTSA